MLFDKLTMFADGLTVPTTQSKTTTSKIVDLRACVGDIGDDLKIYATIEGAANTAGSISTVVQTSPDGTTWIDLVAQVQDGNLLAALVLPRDSKRFVRLAFKTSATALNAAVKVVAGLVDELPSRKYPAITAYPPLPDTAAAGDSATAAQA